MRSKRRKPTKKATPARKPPSAKPSRPAKAAAGPQRSRGLGSGGSAIGVDPVNGPPLRRGALIYRWTWVRRRAGYLATAASLAAAGVITLAGDRSSSTFRPAREVVQGAVAAGGKPGMLVDSDAIDRRSDRAVRTEAGEILVALKAETHTAAPPSQGGMEKAEAKTTNDMIARPTISLPGAARRGLMHQIRSHLHWGCDVDGADAQGARPLYLAAVKGQSKAVMVLLDHDADIESESYKEGYRPLHGAARHGDAAIIEWLIARGATMNAVAGDRTTPMYWAAEGGHADAIATLLRHGADPNGGQGLSPLLAAAQYGHAAAVTQLLDAGADMKEAAPQALIRAAYFGRIAAVKALVGRGVDPNAVAHLITPLQAAIEQKQTGVVKYLLDAGGDANRSTGGGPSQFIPIHRAARDANADIVALLLAHGADPEVKDARGRTALEIASADGSEAVLRLLLKKQPLDPIDAWPVEASATQPAAAVEAAPSPTSTAHE